MLPTILAVVAAVIVLFVLIVATRPADFRVARSAVMSAPPTECWEQVNDFHKWNAWSPWLKFDPNANGKMTLGRKPEAIDYMERYLERGEKVSERYPVGNMGTFYRVRVGPFATQNEGQQACAKLKGSGLDCMVVTE